MTNPEIARKFRRMIDPTYNGTLSRRLVEFDYTAFHVLTTGFEARDPDYMRLARLDMHSYVTAHMIKHPDRERLIALPDEELRERLSEIKEEKRPEFKTLRTKFIRNKQAKPLILGIGFGLGVNHAYEMNQEYFASVGEVRNIHSLLKSLFPKVFRWQDATRAKAHQQGYLRSLHGYIRWFWDVYRPDPKNRGRMIPGDDAEKCIAFLPANDAFGHVDDVEIVLNESGLDEKYGLINDIHDALLFDCHLDFVDECVFVVKRIMEMPSKVLIDPVVAPGGLWCGVEAAVGENWAEMKVVH
jgi:hypothetical protein